MRYEDALARIFLDYIEQPIKSTDEFKSSNKVSEITIEGVINSSKMGIQNEYMKSLLKEYIIENNEDLLAIPTVDEGKRSLVNTKRKTLALKIGQLKSQRRRGEKIGNQIKEHVTKLTNYIRLGPFIGLFNRKELSTLESLKYRVYKPRKNKSGDFRVTYKRKVLNKNQLLEKLEAKI